MRRWTAVAALVLLVLEAGVSAVVALVVGKAADYQHMSLAGVPTSAMAASAYVGFGLIALFLLLVAALLLRVAVRDVVPTKVERIVLILAAVLHGLLAAVLLALSGVWVFVPLAVTLTLLVLILFIPSDGTQQPPVREPSPGGPAAPAAPAA
ncbi:hypothetical protein [Streptacidiphilus fuscans]|uniref:Uncharacterized protein n=1 Tax=Streptacidiphilus fuscans TaxID=2789292 RepID=A0A931B9Y0_9ACTN|nr:hypothetical protein [Streptacidiphilus fuscans]MBF9073254.1 hypothetical protein [Streptacidiphilus fuscans]